MMRLNGDCSHGDRPQLVGFGIYRLRGPGRAWQGMSGSAEE